MIIWDIHPSRLCRQHLLGEHRELHAIWSVLTKGKKGYSKHPETIRWKNKLPALYSRHESLVEEMESRNFNHRSPLNPPVKGIKKQSDFVNTVSEQKEFLRKKGCSCNV